MRCIVCQKRFIPKGDESVFLCKEHREIARKKIRTQMKKTMRWFSLHRAAARAKAALKRKQQGGE